MSGIGRNVGSPVWTWPDVETPLRLHASRTAETQPLSRVSCHDASSCSLQAKTLLRQTKNLGYRARLAASPMIFTRFAWTNLSTVMSANMTRVITDCSFTSGQK